MPSLPQPPVWSSAFRRSDPKRRYFALEGLNAFAMVFYFNYLFFFMEERFGFANFNNLLLCALNGLVYANFAWLAGRFGQRFGYFVALKVGFGGMAGALALGSQARTAEGQVGALVIWSMAMCFTWPTLEALVSEKEPPHRLPRMVGLYNMVWATGSATAYFVGGALLQCLGPRSLFAIPAAIHLTQFCLVWRWQTPRGPAAAAAAARNLGLPLPDVSDTKRPPGVQPLGGPDSPGRGHSPGRLKGEVETQPAGGWRDRMASWIWGPRRSPAARPSTASAAAPELNPRPIARARTFLRMAWVANPFAYVAISTVIAVIPGLATRLSLSPMLAGFFCSTWFFARLGSFVALWLWPGWHYRRTWFFGAYGGLVSGFATILLATRLWMILVAQVVFGAAVGLIYYSSLYYSMDVGEAKGVHSGIHEAAVGVGVCAGPAIGAASIYFFPGASHSATWAVSALLLGGGAALCWIQRQRGRG